MNLAHDPASRTSSSLTLTVLFTHPGGVRDLTLPIFDIDRKTTGNTSFQDRVSVQAFFGAATRTVTVTPGSYNMLDASNPFTAVKGIDADPEGSPATDNSNGNAVFHANGRLDRLIITYDDGPDAPADPGLSGVSLYDMTFTPVPEPGCLLLMGLAGVAGAWRVTRRAVVG